MDDKLTTLQINARTTNNRDLLRSISNVNPEASNYVLKTFAQQLNSLTTNTFVSVYRVDKENITSATNE